MRVVDWCVLLSDNFDSKHSREAVDLPLTCHLSLSLTTFAFRSREVRRLLLDLDPYGGTGPLGMFPLFIKRTANVMMLCNNNNKDRTPTLCSRAIKIEQPSVPEQ